MRASLRTRRLTGPWNDRAARAGQGIPATRKSTGRVSRYAARILGSVLSQRLPQLKSLRAGSNRGSSNLHRPSRLLLLKRRRGADRLAAREARDPGLDLGCALGREERSAPAKRRGGRIVVPRFGLRRRQRAG